MQQRGLVFTPRQVQVLREIAAGRSTEAIALELGISPRTVRAHADALRSKLNVGRRTELPFAYLMATGLNALQEAGSTSTESGNPHVKLDVDENTPHPSPEKRRWRAT